MSVVRRGRVAALNRRAWNDVSDRLQASAFHRHLTPAFFRRGRLTLWPLERRLMGPVRGKTLLHLQCGAGEDTLSWAVLGARVTGVDISEKRIEAARDRARGAGLHASFVRADVTWLPFPAGSFDRAYTSRGALVWLHDLLPWARGIARVLKPGGRLLICDEHPFLNCLVQRGHRTPQVGWDYFDQRPRAWTGWWWLRDGGPKSPKAETAWKLSDALNALAGAGLVLVRAEEAADATGLDFHLPARRRGILPQTLATVWRKPLTGRKPPR